MIVKIEHVGIAVKSLSDSSEFWETLGLKSGGTEIVTSEKVQVSFLPVGESRIELLEPTDSESAVSRHLERRGEGVHHIAFQVLDLDQVLETLKAGGVDVLGGGSRPGAEGGRVAFLHPRSCGGVLVELVEKNEERSEPMNLAPGAAVVAYLRDPREKIWGVLRSLDGAGIVLEGIDLESFEDWVSQVAKGEGGVVGPSLMFLPMSRVERILLDQSSGDLPSLSERFLQRTGRTVQEVLG